MARMKTIRRALVTGEEGHAAPAVLVLVAAVGAIVLGIGAASDSSVAPIIGGVALGIGLLAMTVVNHITVDYGIFRRLNDLEK